MIELRVQYKATHKYVNWLNDPEINRYLESRFTKHAMESVQQYLNTVNYDLNIFFFGIYANDQHVGNIKLNINRHHKHGDIGYLIGKEHWGKGYATEAIKQVADVAFSKHNLNKIFAGVYFNNIGSIKALKKAGFEMESRLRKHYLCDGEYVDKVIMSMWKNANL